MKKKNRIIRSMFCFLLMTGWTVLFCIPPVLAASQNMGGSVTDTLTIKVGYWGMSESDYVEKATYHWTELDDQFGGMLQTHQQAYSFFRESDDGGYQTVIDSARGFYIKDLLKLAGINLNDIEGISFYTQDQSVGYFTNFSYEELFGVNRYFFNDLSFYVQQGVDNNGDPTGEYSINPAVWNEAVEVEPMLALEDGWLSYEPGNEHTAPVYEGLSTGNRFRLLFGQTTPDESRTNQTAKYTHSLYIALNGTPKITTDEVQLADQIGSGYTMEFTMTTSDDTFNDALKQFMNWTSSDENVLKIVNVDIQDDPQYEDAVHVRIMYDILSNGNASISGSFFGAKVTTRSGNDKIEMKPKDDNDSSPDQEADQNPVDQEGSAGQDNQDSSQNDTNDSGRTQSGSSDRSGNSSSTSGTNRSSSSGSAGVTEDRNRSGSSASIGSGSSQGLSTRSRNTGSPSTGTSRNSDVTKGVERNTQNPEAENSDPETGSTVYVLNGEIGKQLRGTNTEIQRTEQASDPEYETLEVNKTEKPDYHAAIGIAMVLLMGSGAGIGVLRYLFGIGKIGSNKRGRLKYV